MNTDGYNPTLTLLRSINCGTNGSSLKVLRISEKTDGRNKMEED